MKKNNIISRWLRAIDQQILIATIMLMVLSFMLVTTTSPSVANKIGASQHFFSSRQLIYLCAGFIILIFTSFLDISMIKRIASLGFIFSLFMLVLVKFYGYEVKGATRWIRIGGFSYQPSEFIKPFFFVVIGWVLSIKYKQKFPSFSLAIILYLMTAILLILQPDFGMLVLTSAVFATQLFAGGLPLIWVFATFLFGLIGIFSAYLFLPHVAARINSFLDPASSGNYQVSKSMLAYKSGGLYGRGPGEGVVKQHLPDSHTDFIFAVAGEEFGAIITIFIIAIFAFIIIKLLLKISSEKDKFIQFATLGLTSQLGLQAIINIGVTLNLLPTKGMTLPFISYGGSSIMANCLAMGMILALTKRKASLTKYKLQYIDV